MAYSVKPVRRSQLISPWGVGAIVPFPEDESLMIAGLDMWTFGNSKSEFIIKDERLEKRLGVKELRRPPDFRDPDSDITNALIKIPAVRFPRWLYCPFCGTMSKSSYYSAQERCSGYEWPHGRSCAGKKFRRKLIPERFIVVCEDGHVDDFPIMEWVHHNLSNSKPKDTCRLRRSTGGVSASLTGVFYECSCGAKRSMAGATNDGALEKVGYKCKGSKPWLGVETDIEHPCEKPVKVVQRGGANVWFGDVRSSIYIPVDTANASRLVLRVLEDNFEMIDSQRVNGEINRVIIDIISKKQNVNANDLYEAALRRIENIECEEEVTEEMSEEAYRLAEYNMLVKDSGGDKIAFHSKNYSVCEYNPAIHPFFKSISLVPKLRETRAFVGFSRLQPNDGQSIKDKKKMLRLGGIDWLPAIEVYGEGIFFEFNFEALEEWSKRLDVISRVQQLSKPYNAMLERRNSQECQLNAKYVMIHTFAHILINQLSFECGYGSSSIRERLYCDKGEEEHSMYGVLIYTASGDAEGSLGGLVRQGLPDRIEDTILDAIKNAKWCSSDPVCIQSPGQGPDSCNLSACHNCALLPETCCENGNRLLDRALIVGTLDNSNIGFFDIDEI
ncbi:DUF1998 domain-containing protein [Clostridium bowmanii]|uniref:DUF1998 domain-containing protein n=1 Tax=Clostridium bowmanii TaxID=132925 RepID=UPI001C0CC25B|nr:DUF1998 domain-containing protein [Clostridium bowmanii]MBU3188335.1 DUF1998 domain-containing protein [Clostridium bowmanii]MCA1072723.1 DUF1998 domain-containing protein [Clostridium bowmanii]